MNEKMLELYKQSQVPHTATDPSNNMPYDTTVFSAKKFAELIVDDIINVVAAQSLLNESALDVYKNLRRIYQSVEPPATNECDSSTDNYDF